MNWCIVCLFIFCFFIIISLVLRSYFQALSVTAWTSSDPTRQPRGCTAALPVLARRQRWAVVDPRETAHCIIHRLGDVTVVRSVTAEKAPNPRSGDPVARTSHRHNYLTWQSDDQKWTLCSPTGLQIFKINSYWHSAVWLFLLFIQTNYYNRM